MIKKSLKNGSVHGKREIQEAMSIIETLRIENMPALFEIVKKCRFTSHEIPADVTQSVEKYNVLKKNDVEIVLKDVVLSAITGRTISDLEVGDPLENGYPQLLSPVG